MKYFLASKSPRRRHLLKILLSDFEVGSADIDEVLDDNKAIDAQIMSIAFQKAVTFDIQLQKENRISEGDIVIGADTVVYLDYLDKILVKPKDKDDAKNILRELSGNKHTVYTGMAAIMSQTNKKVIDVCRTSVYFKDLSEEEIDWYISTGEPMDKAGAYGIQTTGAMFVEKIQGDFHSVMGLSIFKLNKMLKYLINL